MNYFWFTPPICNTFKLNLIINLYVVSVGLKKNTHFIIDICKSNLYKPIEQCWHHLLYSCRQCETVDMLQFKQMCEFLECKTQISSNQVTVQCRQEWNFRNKCI